MKDKKVTITKDRIFYSDGIRNNGIVMDKIAKSITESFCKVVGKNRGHILDVGFGLGYSANSFYSMGVKSYTCIEINKEIYDTSVEWAKDKDNVQIILGDWIDIIPTLNKKFDGIFMDTYEDKNYSKFEDYAKLVSNENCCLSIYEYGQFRDYDLLNWKSEKLEQGDYELPLKPYHTICWTYFVAGQFRKYKFFDSKNILTKELCDELISENKDNLTVEEASKKIDGILHERRWFKSKLKYNKEFEKVINQKLFTSFKPVDMNDIWCSFIKYEIGNGYDRHVETIKDVPLDDDRQYVTTYDITLNDEYEGGEVEVYDEWYKNDRDTFSLLTPKVGECLIYKPYQHVTYRKVTKNTKYQILIIVKNKDLKKNLI